MNDLPDLLTPLSWLNGLGLSEREMRSLNPCVPGEFVTPDALYVNTGTYGVIYQASNEGTLPLVAGRWYLVPSDVADRHAGLRQNAVGIASSRTRLSAN